VDLAELPAIRWFVEKKVDGFREYTYRPAKKSTKEYNFSNERGQVQSI